MGIKYTFNDINKFVEDFGFKLLSKEYKDQNTRLIIKDNQGYRYETTLGTFKRNKSSSPLKFHKTNPFTIHNINLWLKFNNKPFNLISEEYKTSLSKLIFKDDEGYFYSSTLSNLLTGRNPQKFIHTNPYTIQNVNLWCKLNNKPFILINTKWEKGNKKLKWKCLKEDCGEIFEATWGDISQNCGCGYCDGKQVGLSNCLATKRPDLALEWHPIKNKLTPYDILPNSGKKFWWICRECGHNWFASCNNRNNGKTGCPECSKSKGEKRCKEIFDIKNTYYISQKTFDGLIGLGDGLLSYDFYLPNKYNLLIEYQGKQHEKPIDFEGKGEKYAQKQFIKQVEHDRRKKEYALKNGYNFLEIWYWDFNKIEEILDDYLKEVSNKNTSFSM